MQHTITPIAYIRSPYTQKFGIPRQPHLVPAAHTDIIFTPQFSADSVRGLESFDYIWVQFIFHDAQQEGWAQMVRPPRLGGKKKMGVWATRSPHRPNHLGLSLLKLNGISSEQGQVVLHASGGDLLNGTPVVDVKPYLPFIEAHPEAAAGFAHTPPPTLAVVWLVNPDSLSPTTRQIIEQSLAQDPRPAYQNIPERIYGAHIASHEIRFRIHQQTVYIDEYT